MPQLDFFFFFGLYASFTLHIVGMLYFSAYLVPLLISLAKIGGNRTYYFFTSILEVLSRKSCFLYVACTYCYVVQASKKLNSVLYMKSIFTLQRYFPVI